MGCEYRIVNQTSFIYKDNGEYFANYTSHYRFQLPNGKYRILSTTQTDSIPCPSNLNDIVIRQDPAAKVKYAISAPVEYSSPFNDPLSIRMYNRTGVIRLKATDKKRIRDIQRYALCFHVRFPVIKYQMPDS